MRLWILRPVQNLKNNPWDPWYDKAFGFVVRAENEAKAREIAQSESGDEAKGGITRTPWLDQAFSSCDELTKEGEIGVVMCDFLGA